MRGLLHTVVLVNVADKKDTLKKLNESQESLRELANSGDHGSVISWDAGDQSGFCDTLPVQLLNPRSGQPLRIGIGQLPSQ